MKKIILLILICIAFNPLSWAKEKQLKADIKYLNPSAGYRFISDSGDRIVIGILYSEKKRNAEIINVIFIPLKVRKTAEEIYTFSSKRGKITVAFSFKDEMIEHVKVDTDYQPKKSSGDEKKRLILTSEGGYKLIFEFYWNNGELSLVKIYPKVHPFIEYR